MPTGHAAADNSGPFEGTSGEASVSLTVTILQRLRANMGMRRVAVLLALLCLVAACAGQDRGGTAPGSSALAGSDEANNPTAAGEAGVAAGSEEAQSLDDFFGFGSDNPADQQAAFQIRQTRIQEAMRQCMAEQGFEYRPVGPPESSVEIIDEGDREQWIRARGLGITTWYGKEGERGPTPALSGSASGGIIVDEWIDPNQEMVEAMSEAERQAWEDALYGTREEQAEAMETMTDAETGETIGHGAGFGAGCEGLVYEAEYGDQSQVQALWNELQPAMDDMNQRIEADPRIVEANKEWSSCMAMVGYRLLSRQQMHETVSEEFQQRLEDLVGPNMGGANPFEGWTQEEIEAFRAEKTPEEIEAFIAQAQEATGDVDMEAVVALQQEEIDLALADLECGKDFEALYAEVRTEYESDLIAANRSTLEEIREAQGD